MAVKDGGAVPIDPKAKLITAIVLLVLTGVVAYWGYASQHGAYAKPPDKVWFFDASTMKLFAVPMGTVPDKAPSGGRAYQAYVFSCGNCDSAGEADIAYLEDSSARADVSSADSQSGGKPVPKFLQQQRGMMNRKVTTPDKLDTWVDSRGADGIALSTAPGTKCDGKPAKQCYPR